jgi:hypothetical protein
VLAKRRVEVFDALQLPTTQPGEHVPGLNPGPGRRAILGYAVDEHAGRLAQAEIAGDLGGELRGLDADERMLDLSLLEQLVGHADRGRCRNREADGHRSLLRWDVGIGDSDHLALRVNHGTA